MKKDPSGKKKQKPKNNFKKFDKKENLNRFTDMDELDRKIDSLVEENKNKNSVIDQVLIFKYIITNFLHDFIFLN